MGLIYDFHGDKNLIDEQQLVLGFWRVLISWRLVGIGEDCFVKVWFFYDGCNICCFHIDWKNA